MRIAAELRARAGDTPGEPGLLVGRAGLALFFVYYARFSGHPDDRAYGETLIQDIFETLPDTLPFTFCSGLAGVAWLLRHSQQEGLLEVDSDAALSDVDLLLRDRMVDEMREGRFDFLHGALGGALYLLSAIDQPSSREALRTVIADLERHAERAPGGTVAWVNRLPGFDEAGGINLGMAHGMPSIISLLVRFIGSELEVDRCTALIDRAVAFVLEHRQPCAPQQSCFPAVTGQEAASNRLAWCYGDPGIAVALWQAGKARDREEWSQAAIEVLQQAATRRVAPETGVVDASLCHGSAGLALIFARMYAETGQAALRDAALFWLDDTMARGAQEPGYAGYRAFFGQDTPADVATELSVLNGIAGVGLALMALSTSAEPAWDRILLLS